MTLKIFLKITGIKPSASACIQGRPGEVAEYRIPVFKYLKIPDTHVETG